MKWKSITSPHPSSDIPHNYFRIFYIVPQIDILTPSCDECILFHFVLTGLTCFVQIATNKCLPINSFFSYFLCCCYSIFDSCHILHDIFKTLNLYMVTLIPIFVFVRNLRKSLVLSRTLWGSCFYLYSTHYSHLLNWIRAV